MIPTYSFLGDPHGFGHWVLYYERLPNFLINWSISVFLTCAFLGGVLRPGWRKLKATLHEQWTEHKDNQRKIIAGQAMLNAHLARLTAPPHDAPQPVPEAEDAG
jgi:hypothetical protein